MASIGSGRTAPGFALVRAQVDGGHFFFSSSEAVEAAARAGIRAGYVPKLLTSLARQGWIQRIRRGLYSTTGRLPGLATVHP